MATEKRLIDADDALEQLKQAEKEMKVVTPLGCKAVDIKAVLKYIESRPTVDAVEVDKFNIKLHHICIDNEGVPEVKIQIGDRYFILHTDPVDVREVVHGRWIDKTEWIGSFGQIKTECSVCGTIYPHKPGSRGDGKGGKFCEECGARMDGAE